MISPLRVRLLYWMVYAACFTCSLFFSWHFMRGPYPSEMRYAFPTLALAFSQIGATLVCRFLGYSLERRVETRIEPQAGSLLFDEVEVRSHSSEQIFKMMVWLWLGGAGLVVLAAPFLGSRGQGSIKSLFFTLAFLLGLAGFSWLFAWMARRGHLIGKVGASGVEVNMGLGEWRHLEWEDIESAGRIEVVNLFGDMTSSSIHFKDAKGKIRAAVGLSSTPPEQQAAFSQVISRYLRASSMM